MKRAVLYVRVSTDEQADRGYSLGVQREQLEKYCKAQGIEVVIVFVEDHSAKNFDRPEFAKFLSYAKSNYRNIDYFLFVSWDRFSRNAPDAYNMIRKLKKWDIEPQAITQPIDFSVPQSKIMLSIYLTLPEVDNDIRSDKVKSGMRGANKLGRWTTTAPIGYKNRRDEQNKPIIVPKDTANLIAWAFKEVAKNERALNHIRLELNQKGVKVSKSTFSRMVRNPVYMGKIRVVAYKDEPEQIVEGLHEGIVTEELFNEVQLVLSGRVKKQNKKTSFRDRDELPLRGLLSCSNCGKHVTGSASKSRSGDKHYYYHCMHCKKERFRADVANSEVEKLLSEIQISEEVKKLQDVILHSELKGNPKQRAQQKSTFVQELNKLEARKEQLQNTFLDGDLDPKDYTELKNRLENRIFEVRAKLDEFKNEQSNFKEQLNKKFKILPNIVQWYRNSTVQEKKQLLGSIFPERFVFEKNQVRTTCIDEVIALILKYTGRFEGKEKGQAGYNSHLSHLVSPLGFEPRTASLEGRCSIQLSYEPSHFDFIIKEKKTTTLIRWWLSGWQDSNLRPPAPKAGAMTGLRYTPILYCYKSGLFQLQKENSFQRRVQK